MGAIITLTSDFGLTDIYAAAMKGVILGINPDVHLVDISHTIGAQDISAAAFMLSTVYRYFPQNSIHLVVIDPGVGSERKGIVLKTPDAYFVAPDNGVLSYILRDYRCEEGTLYKGLVAIHLTKEKYWRTPVSNTFHGRDIFAPVAAYLSLGIPLSELGDNISTIHTLPIRKPRTGVNSVTGDVIHIDRFGNLITNIEKNIIPGMYTDVTVKIGNQVIKRISRSYSEEKGLLALFGSTDCLEIALREGNASKFLNARIGDEVFIRLQGGNPP